MEFFQIQAMEPIPRQSVPTGDDWFYQIKWDGIRILTFFDGNSIKLRTKKGFKRTTEYPELNELTKEFGNTTWLLDGEIIVANQTDKSDHPKFITTNESCEEVGANFFHVLKRDRTKNPTQKLLKTFPVRYKVFDLLMIDNQWLVNEPFIKRRELLNKHFNNNKFLQIIRSYSDGLSLFNITSQQNHEGIVAKKSNSIYHPGKKHSEWFKIKHLKYLQAYLGGVIVKENQIKSLLLGQKSDLADYKLNYIGRASTGLTQKELNMLKDFAFKNRVSNSPFGNLSKVDLELADSKESVVFLSPQLKLQVKYTNWTPGGNLRHPVINGFII
ncbi:ATP-dependent DNA ligase [Natranaerobius thermophilus]|uniref:DNA ligase (ATP) n=1 Tax=Natranaerobius thermophilus (strain ATCC BAA-1301 / DSM 18059 / JW/NM-WN-LF) TaxID=457570 RepID=B2A483_NATTJ|nr:ATP-dependent DNA ligase [Natranaerobius thermophilus]ACB83737.1 ATP dependent DNA ligase [Natranaerobius thermophilus JW/NM-WN-LF]